MMRMALLDMKRNLNFKASSTPRRCECPINVRTFFSDSVSAFLIKWRDGIRYTPFTGSASIVSQRCIIPVTPICYERPVFGDVYASTRVYMNVRSAATGGSGSGKLWQAGAAVRKVTLR